MVLLILVLIRPIFPLPQHSLLLLFVGNGGSGQGPGDVAPSHDTDNQWCVALRLVHVQFALVWAEKQAALGSRHELMLYIVSIWPRPAAASLGCVYYLACLRPRLWLHGRNTVIRHSSKLEWEILVHICFFKVVEGTP
ncbi:hypothetical protein B0T22DRAFT_266792 [Podospora appendiculata]|uniref:Uncharacterized protein n=1 Tax=Podospora appendiculata TaxID=314037 RepID=A0AAE0X3S2_9PEZI|nr:hypothetical protein B0T22DRAFT_266792 [Podospora appendiculata]